MHLTGLDIQDADPCQAEFAELDDHITNGLI
jgi:hypothetical protein